MQNVPIAIAAHHPTRSAGLPGEPPPRSAPMPTVGPREVWAKDEMRQACARRDVASVYRILNAAGVSQRRLAAVTGQAQSDISEIMRRGRIVSHVDVLERIADGLGTPRGWWGLAHDFRAAYPAAADAATDTRPPADPEGAGWQP